ncbi:MAG: DUF998 domain-containing protein [Bacteroidales bacterium]|nr:DUF998 domain-containing protein [Bacteroidales bacterium]
MKTDTDQTTNRKNPAKILLTGTYILMLSSMFILPFFSKPKLSVINNTLSELGAQSSPVSWIMNSTFALLAMSSVISGWGCFKGFIFHRTILMFFGISLLLSAIFNSISQVSHISYNIGENGWHTYFSCLSWINFIILTFSTALILKEEPDRFLAGAAGISSILLLLIVSEAVNTAGIWQRLQFIISFGWMINAFDIHNRENLKHNP